jgi:hypothetical protein
MERAHTEAIAARAMPFDIDTLGERCADLRATVGKLQRYLRTLTPGRTRGAVLSDLRKVEERLPGAQAAADSVGRNNTADAFGCSDSFQQIQADGLAAEAYGLRLEYARLNDWAEDCAGFVHAAAQSADLEADTSQASPLWYAMGFNSRKKALSLARSIEERYGVEADPIAPPGAPTYWVRLTTETLRRAWLDSAQPYPLGY